EDAQLDLAPVRADEDPAVTRDERLADALPVLGADRRALQVRIRRDQPARRARRLLQRAVHAAGLGVHRFAQDARVGVDQLRERALPYDLAADLVLRREALEHLGGGRVA